MGIHNIPALMILLLCIISEPTPSMTTQKINTRKHTPLPPPLGLNQCIYLNRLEKTLDSSLTAACVAAWFTCWRIPCGMLPYTWAAACIPADDPPPPGRLHIIIHTHGLRFSSLCSLCRYDWVKKCLHASNHASHQSQYYTIDRQDELNIITGGERRS